MEIKKGLIVKKFGLKDEKITALSVDDLAKLNLSNQEFIQYTNAFREGCSFLLFIKNTNITKQQLFEATIETKSGKKPNLKIGREIVDTN